MAFGNQPLHDRLADESRAASNQHLLATGSERALVVAPFLTDGFLRGVDARWSALVSRFASLAAVPPATLARFDEVWAFDDGSVAVDADDRPTAIVCGNDEIAMQVYCAVLAAGLRIPEDISIVGFDDFQTVSLGLRPQLTTAALPYFSLGMEGAQLLEALLSGEVVAGKREADCPVVQRHSTASASR